MNSLCVKLPWIIFLTGQERRGAVLLAVRLDLTVSKIMDEIVTLLAKGH